MIVAECISAEAYLLYILVSIMEVLINPCDRRCNRKYLKKLIFTVFDTIVSKPGSFMAARGISFDLAISDLNVDGRNGPDVELHIC